MRLLLDTHVLLWWLADNPRLTPKARMVIADGKNEVFVSAASAWEITIKQSLKKLRAPTNLEDTVRECGFGLLPIEFHHAVAAGRLPPHHQDPFDRMLVAQALAESLKMMTHDNKLGTYGVGLIHA